MFTRIWRFRAAAGREAEFEAVYGPEGAWVALFRQGAGYVGTELRRQGDGSGEYLTEDRWESARAWEEFRQAHADAYEALDRQCGGLTSSEVLVAERVGDVAPAGGLEPDCGTAGAS